MGYNAWLDDMSAVLFHFSPLKKSFKPKVLGSVGFLAKGRAELMACIGYALPTIHYGELSSFQRMRWPFQGGSPPEPSVSFKMFAQRDLSFSFGGGAEKLRLPPESIPVVIGKCVCPGAFFLLFCGFSCWLSFSFAI